MTYKQDYSRWLLIQKIQSSQQCHAIEDETESMIAYSSLIIDEILGITVSAKRSYQMNLRASRSKGLCH